MVSRFNKILILLILIGLSYYAFSMNSQEVTVRFGEQRAVTAPLASVLLGTFTIGIFLSSLIASFFSIRSYFRERELLRRDRRRQALWDDFAKARGLRALLDLPAEHELLRTIIDREPASALVRLELARNLEEQGKLKEALKVVDATRALEGSQVESLMRSAELNVALGNKTAALDALARLSSLTPSYKVFALARDIAESLGKFDDALEFHERAIEIRDSREGSQDEMRGQVLELRKLLRTPPARPEDLLAALQNFTRQHPQCREGWEELSHAEARAGNSEKAAAALLRAGRIGNDADPYFQAAQFYVSERRPDQALAALKTATGELTGPPLIDAYLNLMKLCVALQMYGEVERHQASLVYLVEQGSVTLSRSQENSLQKLLGYAASLTGDLDSARRIWRQLALGDQPEQTKEARSLARPNGEVAGPAPRLSTP